METAASILSLLHDLKPLLRDQFHVEKIALFGSFSRDEAQAESDIDILVRFDQQGLNFDNFMELKFHLESVFGRKVDLGIEDSVRPEFRRQIEREARYA